ncbi:MAG TPA: hypothetical protein ENF73_06445, partial [Proteobacteria bacterium]|nr:hypothetical protein [Pseudomonadota bacterium]
SQKIPEAPIVTHGPKKRVAVLEFANKSRYGRNKLGPAATDVLITELVKSGLFIVVERDRLNKLLEEQKLERTAGFDPATAARAGRLLGVNAVVIGAITEFGVKQEGVEAFGYKKKVQTAECTVDIRVVETETGRVLYADSGHGIFTYETKEFMGMGQKAGYNQVLADKALRAAISQFLNNVIAQISYIEWSGRIAKVSGNQIIVNAGQQTGLKIGDVLVVRGLGEEVIDPDTGLSLGREPGPVKGEIQVVEFFGEDASICKVVSGAGFAVGDMVKYKSGGKR